MQHTLRKVILPRAANQEASLSNCGCGGAHLIDSKTPTRSHKILYLQPQPPPQSQPPNENKPPQPSETSMVSLSIVFYGAMTLIGIKFGENSNVADQLLGNGGLLSLNIQGTLAFLTPLLLFFAFSLFLADKVPAFQQLKELFETTLVPGLKNIPIWGLALMALCAGIGEETFFRGWLQPTLAAVVLNAGSVSANASVAVGLIATSVVFGLLHALTPLYFWFATFAGFVFGVEYLTVGLKAASATHAIYDFIALLAVVEFWSGSSSKKKK